MSDMRENELKYLSPTPTVRSDTLQDTLHSAASFLTQEEIENTKSAAKVWLSFDTTNRRKIMLKLLDELGLTKLVAIETRRDYDAIMALIQSTNDPQPMPLPLPTTQLEGTEMIRLSAGTLPTGKGWRILGDYGPELLWFRVIRGTGMDQEVLTFTELWVPV